MGVGPERKQRQQLSEQRLRSCCFSSTMERERLLYSENLLGRDGEEEVEVAEEAALVANDQRPAWGLQLITSLIAQRPLASILTILHASLTALLPSQNVPDEQVAGLLRELVVQQHRTMFYTVTVAGCPSPPPDHSQHTPALQWQLASSLVHSRGLAQRTERAAPAYYSLAFLDPD